MTVDAGWKNKLYFGDNLDILRNHVADSSVDLTYLFGEGTESLEDEAIKAGYYVPALYGDRKFRKVQIVTQRELLSSGQVEYLRVAPVATFKKAAAGKQMALM